MELLPSRSSSGSRSSCSSPSRSPGLLALPLIALLGASVLLASCDEDDPAKEIDACIEESIAQGRSANWTQGLWHIDGSGTRENCEDESLDADELTLDSKPIRVHQQGHYLFLENPELHPGFSLSGLVGDRCIHIKTSEKTSYGTIYYDLPARFLGSSSFSGQFRSSGPTGCEGKGDFAVGVKLDPVPATPVNPAPADAGVPSSELCKSCKLGCTDLEAEYVKDCQDSCEKYVCKIGLDAGLDADASEAGDDAEAAAPEAGTDAADDVETEAGDASEDALEDAADDAVDGESADADAASEAGQPDSSGPVYVLWDGSVEIDQKDLEDAANGCSVGAGSTAPASNPWLLLALSACLAWRRRSRGVTP